MKPRPGRTTPKRFQDLPDMVTPGEARAYLRISKNAMYDRLKDRRVESVRFGRLIRIPREELLKK
jgi:excisionase family DNA binding protein